MARQGAELLRWATPDVPLSCRQRTCCSVRFHWLTLNQTLDFCQFDLLNVDCFTVFSSHVAELNQDKEDFICSCQTFNENFLL